MAASGDMCVESGRRRMLNSQSHDERLLRQSSTRPLVSIAVDDEETRAAYAYTLFATGFDVTTTDDVNAARDNGSAKLPDIIVADVSPGSHHGWDFVRQLRRDRRTCDIPIVAVTVDAGAASRDRARREGCAAVCVKTCPGDLLASGLRAVLDHTNQPRR